MVTPVLVGRPGRFGGQDGSSSDYELRFGRVLARAGTVRCIMKIRSIQVVCVVVACAILACAEKGESNKVRLSMAGFAAGLEALQAQDRE